MEKVLGSSIPGVASTKRLAARVALVDVQEPARSILTECFKQFGLDAVAGTPTIAERFTKEKFEGCVVRLGPSAEAVIQAARNSAANSRMVIYGLGGTAQEAMKYSRFGMNALLTEPLERQAVLKLVRATHLLVVHEFRRYVRVPVATEVAVTANEGRRFVATSHDLSSGGMSLRSSEDVAPGSALEVSFALLTLPRIWVRAIVSWRKPEEKVFGIQFDVHDERRVKIKEWVDAYLES